MGYVSSQRKTRKVKLSNPKYWVEIVDEILQGDIRKIAELNKESGISIVSTTTDLNDAQTNTIVGLVTAWNLDDDEGNPVPVTREYALLLKKADVDIIISESNKLLPNPEEEEAQKKSS